MQESAEGRGGAQSSAAEEGRVGALEAALDLLRRLPPQAVEENLLSLLQLLPGQAAQLLNTVDTPSKIRICPTTSREYLACDYNRDGDSFRSPWSDAYDPPLPAADGIHPPAPLRTLEIVANEAFDTYRSQYYEGGISSVYVWDVPSRPAAFAAAVLLKKVSEGGGALRLGAWDAIHVLEVEEAEAEAEDGAGAQRSALYKLTTTIILHLDTAVPRLDEFVLSGNVTRQSESRLVLAAGGSPAEHVANMGRMVEEMESRMRGALQEIYFGKTHDVINEIRPVVPAGFLRHQADLQREMASRLQSRLGATRPTEPVDD